MDRVVEALCDYADALAYELLDDRTQQQAKLVLVDAMAAALAAAQHPSAQAARALALEADGRPGHGSTVLGTRHRSTPDLAAFAGCATMRCLDHGDAYRSLVTAYPSDQIPGLLAAAELSGAGGRDVLTATVLAYEILCRLCDVARIRGWQAATLTAISTAAATSRVLGLSRRQTAHAVSLTTVSHAALDVAAHGAGSLDWRAYAGANAVRQGVFAALLARQGVQGPPRPFEGEGGFFERLSAGPFDLPTVEETETRPRIHDVLLRKHGVSAHLQTAAEAAIELHAGLAPGVRVASVRVATNAATIAACARPDAWHPESPAAARASLPHTVAVALLDGHVGPAQHERLRDPEVDELMKRVKVMESLTTRDRRTATTSIEATDDRGDVHSAACEATDGFPERAMTPDQANAKFTTLTAGVLSPTLGQTVLDVLWGFEALEDVDILFQLLGGAAG
jgi:2-methylcitrate dehydratase